jgi:exonuclease SbcC
MKILNIKIENIASLKGSHFINFENFGEHNSIFAITGETGSGKSTILNAISLSLYGQNYKKNLNQLDFITLGESVGNIELQFKINKNTFKAIWTCRLKKNNGENLKTPKPKRDLYQQVESKWIAKEFLPEEIIKLNFDQFCKTMILNQGEFSKFLTSSFKERKDILERFYNGERLELLSLKTRQRINNINQDIENLSYQIAGLNDYSQINQEETKANILINEKDIKQFKSFNQLLNKSSQKMKDILGASNDLKTNNDRISKMRQDIVILTKEKNNLIQRNEKIELNLKNYKINFNKTEPLLIKCRDINNKNISMNEETIKHSKELLDNTRRKVQEKEIYKETTSENEILKKKIKINKSNSLFLNLDLKTLEEVIKLEGQKQKFSNDLNITSSEIKFSEATLKEIEDDANKTKKLISEYEIIINKKTINDTQRKVLSLEQKKVNILNSQTDYKTTNSRISEIEALIIKDERDQKKLISSSTKLNKVLCELIDRQSENEAALNYYKLTEATELCKHESIILGNCIVCDSDIKDLKTKSSTSTKHQDYKKTLKSKEAIVNEIQEKKESITKEETNLSIKKENILKNTKMKKEICRELSLSLLKSIDLEAKDQDVLKSDIIDKKFDKSLLEIQEEILFLNKEKEKVNEVSYKIESAKTDLSQYREKYKKQSNKLNKLRSSEIDYLKEIGPITKKINTLLETNNVSDDLMESLLFSKDILKDQQDLNKTNQELEIQTKRIDGLEKEIKEKTEYLSQIEDKITKNKLFITQQISNKDPDSELENLKAQKLLIDEEIKESRNELKRSEISLVQKTSQIKNFKEQIEHITNQLDISFKEIKDLIKTSKEIVIEKELNGEDKTLIEDYKRFINKINDSKSIENLHSDLLNETYQFNLSLMDRFKILIDETNSVITEEKTLLKEKNKSINKVTEINKEVELKTSEKLELEDLYSLVGRDEFRNYVLSIIEKRLIAQTNSEISQLCDDRYKIIHLSKTNKMAPDFYVIDKYKAGLTRKISTLSGGETFMVSLAMAMALSELSRGSNEIDSFFIDEGFGTLDDDSLEDVLEMINNIQARGKSIGLITHVKKLADRIPINIQLNKSQLGNSTLNIKFQ